MKERNEFEPFHACDSLPSPIRFRFCKEGGSRIYQPLTLTATVPQYEPDTVI